jgi:hypothetical protein
VQGSGKSHTVSVLLENMLVPGCRAIGALEKALSGLVLHFGPGGDTALPCEAAWLGRPRFQSLQVPPVIVYVSRSALQTMRRVYARVGDNVVVEPLLFTESELDAEAFLSMMAVESSDTVPLYMHVILVSMRNRTGYQGLMRSCFYLVNSEGPWGKLYLRKVCRNIGGAEKVFQSCPESSLGSKNGTPANIHKHICSGTS